MNLVCLTTRALFLVFYHYYLHKCYKIVQNIAICAENIVIMYTDINFKVGNY